jgi:copper(I)-binding protein
VAAAALVPVAAGCEAGQNAPTQRWHQPTAGTSALVASTIRVNNMFVLGPTPGFSLKPGDSAGVFLALFNEGAPDRLVRVSAPGVAASVRLPGGGLRLGRQQSVRLTGPVPRIVLQGLTRSLRGGETVRLTLDFQNAGSVTLPAPVMPRAQYYSTYSPAPPSPSASPSPTGTSKHRKRRRAPTASPTP